jgi:F0F1-type ATP synthase delta subunit
MQEPGYDETHSRIQGVCSQTHFLKKIITNSFKLAYLLCPPEDYTRSLEHLVYKALKTESKILDAPLEVTTTLTKNDGSQITTVQFDSKLANVIWRMRESYENRLRGTAIHRSTQLNRNVNENYNSSAGAISADTLAQLSPAKLQELVEALQNGTAQDVQFTIPAETTKGIVTDEE